MRALTHVILFAFVTDTMLERRPCLTQTLRRVGSESSVDDVMCIISFRPLQLPSVWSLLLSDVTLHHGEIKGIAGRLSTVCNSAIKKLEKLAYVCVYPTLTNRLILIYLIPVKMLVVSLFLYRAWQASVLCVCIQDVNLMQKLHVSQESHLVPHSVIQSWPETCA